MKKVLLALIAALTVYACTSEREEETPTPEAQKKELIIINQDESSTNKTESDTVKVIGPLDANPLDGGIEPTDDDGSDDDNETVNPGQLGTPPTRP